MAKNIRLEGDVGWEITAASLREQLPEDSSDVVLDIYSYGGSIFEGMELYNTIAEYPGNVTARVGAIGASAASFFPLSADKVVSKSNSTMMIHKGWSLAIGNADEMRKNAEILDGLDGLIADIYAKKTGKEKKQILKDMADETWLMGWESIVDYGLADEVEDAEESVVEKSEALAKIEGIKAKMRASEMFKKDIERAAAWLPKKMDNSVVDGKNKIEEGKMDKKEIMSFEDYLKSNPEAEARHMSLVNEAVADARKGEAARIDEILDLAGVVLSDEAKDAISTGKDPGDFAKAAIKMAKAKAPEANAAELKGIHSAREVSEDMPHDGIDTTAQAEAYVEQLKKNKAKRR